MGASSRHAIRFSSETTVPIPGPLLSVTSSTQARMMARPRPDSGSRAIIWSSVSGCPAGRHRPPERGARRAAAVPLRRRKRPGACTASTCGRGRHQE